MFCFPNLFTCVRLIKLLRASCASLFSLAVAGSFRHVREMARLRSSDGASGRAAGIVLFLCGFCVLVSGPYGGTLRRHGGNPGRFRSRLGHGGLEPRPFKCGRNGSHLTGQFQPKASASSKGEPFNAASVPKDGDEVPLPLVDSISLRWVLAHCREYHAQGKWVLSKKTLSLLPATFTGLDSQASPAVLLRFLSFLKAFQWRAR